MVASLKGKEEKGTPGYTSKPDAGSCHSSGRTGIGSSIWLNSYRPDEKHWEGGLEESVQILCVLLLRTEY